MVCCSDKVIGLPQKTWSKVHGSYGLLLFGFYLFIFFICLPHLFHHLLLFLPFFQFGLLINSIEKYPHVGRCSEQNLSTAAWKMTPPPVLQYLHFLNCELWVSCCANVYEYNHQKQHVPDVVLKDTGVPSICTDPLPF